jgi:multidrug efflux pump
LALLLLSFPERPPDSFLPKGISFEWTDLAYQQQERGTPTLLVFGAAPLFVFLVLVAQYENWKLPLSIVLILLMCLLASVTGLLSRGMPIDILAQIGFVVLVAWLPRMQS